MKGESSATSGSQPNYNTHLAATPSAVGRLPPFLRISPPGDLYECMNNSGTVLYEARFREEKLPSPADYRQLVFLPRLIHLVRMDEDQ
jgi:hypothetical protein